MDYEIVNLEEKTVVGISARTNNAAPDMGTVIGGLWNRFYGEGIYESIPEKRNEKALGIYTDYTQEEKGDYTIAVGCETEDLKRLPAGTEKRKLPAGRYAKFVVKGDMHKAVAEFWQQLWSMELPRSFLADFEEYQNGDPQNAEIHIYIGLKDA